MIKLNQLRLLQCRYSSQWIKTRTEAGIDVEKLFISRDVQELLNDLTEIDLENKVFRPRRTSIQQRSHFALMTDERLEKTRNKMKEEARRFLQLVPLKEPRSENVQVLSKDRNLDCFDTSKIVFTDITFDATDQDRTVVVREPDGTLRTANPEEHDRMNRTYYKKPNRPVNPPPVFTDPYLQNALDREEHEFVLDWACWFYEPNDPSYVKLTQTVFDRLNEKKNYHVLVSTRHFGQFVFYTAINNNITGILNYFGGMGRLKDCANLIRLQKCLLPDWRVSIAQGDSDDKIVKDFVNQNARHRDQIKDLLNFINNGTIKSESDDSKQIVGLKGAPFERKPTIKSNSLIGKAGYDEYNVKVIRGEGTPGKGRWRNRRTSKNHENEGKEN